MDAIIANKYILLEQIGKGTFGFVYKGQNKRTLEFVAIKVEPIVNDIKLLKNEAKIYQYLNHTMSGIPLIKWFGRDKYNYYMVIDLLGESLESLKRKRKRLSLKLTLKIGIQVLKILQNLHSNGLVHRDIKPDNFLFGIGEKSNQIYIIDFGFCKVYEHNGIHIDSYRVGGLIGSLDYASISAHNYCQVSRKDDIESLCYMLIYLYMGKLDWQVDNLSNNEELMNEQILNYKKQVIYNNDIPIVIVECLRILENVKFKEEPDYSLLISKFVNVIAAIDL